MNAKFQKLVENAKAAIKALSTRPGEGGVLIYNPSKYNPDDPESLAELRKLLPDDAEVICLIPDNGRGDVPNVIGGEESGQ